MTCTKQSLHLGGGSGGGLEGGAGGGLHMKGIIPIVTFGRKGAVKAMFSTSAQHVNRPTYDTSQKAFMMTYIEQSEHLSGGLGGGLGGEVGGGLGGGAGGGLHTEDSRLLDSEGKRSAAKARWRGRRAHENTSDG